MTRLKIMGVAAAGIMGALLSCTPALAAETFRITEEALYDRIYASWLGQMAGNIYGLPHENIHIETPGPDAFPYGYDFLEIPFYQSHFAVTRMTPMMETFGGAFSDDDTDIEYIYLELMEEQGIEPSYGAIRKAWMAHIDDWVWIANRQTLALMHQGYAPPYTGARRLNAEWFQIDPQLINEIWAITAPGMVSYARDKSRWAAHISADDWGTEPTIAYGAMFAAAFYEADVERLVDIGAAALPEGAKFARTIGFVKELAERHPEDWSAARKELAKAYYEESERKTIWNANLNGACAIMALLYGKGDFQETMDLASACGFDADNQAATLGGLLGIAQGTAGIPREFLYPVEGWTLPFNDRYLNRSRRDMPSTSIRAMARRTAALAEQVILSHGGQKKEVEGEPLYEVNTAATFTPPLELAPLPPQTLIAGTPVAFPLYAGGNGPDWRVEGLPPGLSLSAEGVIAGTPSSPGRFHASVTASEGGESRTLGIAFIVKGANLAPAAEAVLGPGDPVSLEALRDGKGYEGESIETERAKTRTETFGYRWAAPQTIGSLLLTAGRMGEYGGWFVSLTAEYEDGQGNWIAVPEVTMRPEPVLQNDKQRRPHYARYLIEFPKIETKAVRLKMLNGGEGDARYVSLAELGVFP